MMHYVDTNADGMIDYEEFLAFAVHQAGPLSKLG
jgi:Ca2+-binding EF-hand superfamily protein